MIELTDRQLHELSNDVSFPLRVVHPQTQEEFVLLRREEYERLSQHEYDDSPWTREELESLAAAMTDSSEWDEWDEPQTQREQQ